MRSLPYFILAYLMMGLQIGLGGYLKIGGVAPNLVLLAVVFIAVNAPAEAALLGAFGLGVMQDLATLNTLGLFALSYGLVAMFVVSTQQFVYRGHPLTHLSLGFAGCLMTSFILLLHAWIRGPEKLGVMMMFYHCLYTAILAPLVLGVLNWMRRSFGFRTRHRLR